MDHRMFALLPLAFGLTIAPGASAQDAADPRYPNFTKPIPAGTGLSEFVYYNTPSVITLRTDGKGQILTDGAATGTSLKVIENKIQVLSGDDVLAEIEMTRDSRVIMPPNATLTVARRPATRSIAGFSLSEVPSAVASHLGVDAESCAMIVLVNDGYGADKAGLEKYDIVVGCDGASAGVEDVKKAIRESGAGDTIDLTVRRGDRTWRSEVEITEVAVPGYPNTNLNTYSPLLKAYYGQLGATSGAAADYRGWAGRLDTAVIPYGVGFGAPAPDASEAGSDDLEERLARLEKMVQQLLDRER